MKASNSTTREDRPGIRNMDEPALGRGWERNPGIWPSWFTVLSGAETVGVGRTEKPVLLTLNLSYLGN